MWSYWQKFRQLPNGWGHEHSIKSMYSDLQVACRLIQSASKIMDQSDSQWHHSLQIWLIHVILLAECIVTRNSLYVEIKATTENSAPVWLWDGNSSQLYMEESAFRGNSGGCDSISWFQFHPWTLNFLFLWGCGCTLNSTLKGTFAGTLMPLST